MLRPPPVPFAFPCWLPLNTMVLQLEETRARMVGAACSASGAAPSGVEPWVLPCSRSSVSFSPGQMDCVCSSAKAVAVLCVIQGSVYTKRTGAYS